MSSFLVWMTESFQSTLSMRRATEHYVAMPDGRLRISIHALHEESDRAVPGRVLGATISIHALHEESDFDGLDMGDLQAIFQSTLSMRRATRPSG